MKSAELVLWLCNMLGFAADRYHISGHSEADPSATHSSCPQRVLNWDTLYGGHLRPTGDRAGKDCRCDCGMTMRFRPCKTDSAAQLYIT